MRLVDLDGEIGAHSRSGLSNEVFEDGNANAHVAVVDHGDRLRSPVERGHLLVTQATDATNQGNLVSSRCRDNLVGGLGQAEIDQDITRTGERINVVAAFPYAGKIEVIRCIDKAGNRLAHSSDPGNAYSYRTDTETPMATLSKPKATLSNPAIASLAG